MVAGLVGGKDVASDGDGLGTVIVTFVIFSVIWAVLFYLLVAISPRVQNYLGQSSKEHENDRYWVARNIIGTIHAVVVSVLVLPPFFELSGATAEVRFAASPKHLDWCDSPEMVREGHGSLVLACQVVAMAGVAFVAFTVVDVFLSGAHGLATWDYMVHHFAFITAGLIIRLHCMLPFNAAALLAMEASTPFLNTLLLVRNRGEAYEKSVPVMGVIFVSLYVIFRLIICVYAAALLYQYRNEAIPHGMPLWQAWFLYAAVGAGTAVQFFWFPKIVQTFGAGLLALLNGGAGNADEDASAATLGKRQQNHLLGVESDSPTSGFNTTSIETECEGS